MFVDARSSAHAVRRPVDAFDNLDQLFDAMAYDKGQAVLEMLEQWLSPETMRQGVQSYLTAHAWGNAAGADLWNAISKAAGRDISETIRSFLDQPGVPLVEVEQVGVNQVRLRQRRFMSSGAAEVGRWQIPVTLKYSDGGAARTRTVLLSEPEQTVTLESKGTVAWLYPNAEERGYYRWRLEEGMLRSLPDLAAKDLSVRERAGMVANLSALLEGGLIKGDEELRLLGRLAGDGNAKVVGGVLEALDRVRVRLITPELGEPFAVYLRRSLGPALDRIGMERAPGEPEPVAMLRPKLFTWLGSYGRDRRVIDQARLIADSYLANSSGVDAALAGPALALVAEGGHAGQYQQFLRRFEEAKLPAERERFLLAIASVRDTALLARTLDYLIKGPLRAPEIESAMRTIARLPENEPRLFEWTMRNWPALVERIPDWSLPDLVRTAGVCSPQRLEKARAFFGDPSHHAAGMDKELERLADQVRDCSALRAREGESVARYLNGLRVSKQ
jgi:alanyl aminopeptidase